MKKFLALTALTFSFATANAFAASFTGYVSDEMCSKNTAKAGSPDHAACAAKCIKGGSDPVLVVGDKVYKFAEPAKMASYAGKKITVDGTLDNNIITVGSVKD